MKKQSAGILVFRRSGVAVEVLLEHPGGPYWVKKDLGVWSVPKGEYEDGEGPLDAAKREFREETGQPAPEGDYLELGSVKRNDGKVISVWAVEGEVDIGGFKSNLFALEWPPKSGNVQQFPESDKVAWFTLEQAKLKLFDTQVPFIDRLVEKFKLTLTEPPAVPEQLQML